MNLLINTIEQNLILSRPVTLPRLGTFAVVHFPATVTNTAICPPHAEVHFTPICQYTNAVVLTLADSQQLQEALQQRGEVSLGRVGSLHRQADGTLLFSAASHAYLPDNMGLRALPYAARTQVIEWPRTRRVIHYAAAAMIGAAMLLFAPQRNEVVSADYASLNPIEWVKLVANTTQEVAQEAVPATPHAYHIIVASVDQQAASRYCKQLLLQGYEQVQLLPFHNQQRVSLCHYDTRQDATQALRQLREQKAFARAWMLYY